jgi:L-malate glycosyltransferase
LLLRAFAAIDKEQRVKLILCGGFDDPTLQTELEEESKLLNVKQYLRRTGTVRPGLVADIMRTMHVFTVTSDHDGLPNALLEAASVGVPLVVTDVGGMHDIIEDEINGLLVPARDARALSKAISRVFANDRLAERLGHGALELARRLSPERERQSWISLYQRILRQRAFAPDKTNQVT